MKRAYWEKMASSYHEEIFDVLQNDRLGLIRNVIAENASPQKTVMDIGCAIGKWLPLLSPVFGKVLAVDISQKNLDIARALHPQLQNVEYLRADMSARESALPPCDFALCINAILTPSEKDRTRFFSTLSSCIRKEGLLVLSVPSLESHMLASVIQRQFRIDRRYFPPEKKGREALRKWNNLREGNADIDGVPHKHYLREELQLLLDRNGFQMESIGKIEYGWETEFHHPPDWLQTPKPWDWMVVGRKE